MKRIFWVVLAAVMVCAAIAPVSDARGNADTSTCPAGGRRCVGSGGGAGD